MAIRKIVYEGDNLLREQSKTVTVFDDKLAQLIDDMFDTMRHENGCGLAAPQVGILKRVCVISAGDGEPDYAFVNPVITSKLGSQIRNEGCLSVKNRSGRVKRPRRVEVSYQDKNGNPQTLKAQGYLATICCHEIDHLDGVLYIDKIIG